MSNSRSCTKCGVLKPITAEHYQPNPRYHDGFQRQCKLCQSTQSTLRSNVLRGKIIDALGGVCVGCGITDSRVLCFDHKNGGGTLERKVIATTVYYRSILDRLDSFQLLCWNCNHLKRMNEREFGHRVLSR